MKACTPTTFKIIELKHISCPETKFSILGVLLYVWIDIEITNVHSLLEVAEPLRILPIKIALFSIHTFVALIFIFRKAIKPDWASHHSLNHFVILIISLIGYMEASS